MFSNESLRSDHNLNSQTAGGTKSDGCDRNSNHPFKINQAVRHIGTGAKLIVIRYGREQIEYRKPDLYPQTIFTSMNLKHGLNKQNKKKKRV